WVTANFGATCFVESNSLVQILRGANPVGERCYRWGLTLAQDQGAVAELSVGTKVEGFLIFVGDDEAEGINVQLARRGKVSDDDFHVCTAQNIWGLDFSHDDSLGLKKGRGERRRVKLVSLLAEDWVMYFAEVDVNSLLVGVEVNGAVAALDRKSTRLNSTEWGTQVTYVIGV